MTMSRDAAPTEPIRTRDWQDWPRAGGDMGSLVRAFDWAATRIGPKSAWPHGLRTTIDVMLASPVAMVTLWGPDGIMIYNDAYSIFAGGNHPRLLGCPVVEEWPEVADFNRRVLEAGLRGEALSFVDQHRILNRHGAAEDVWVDLDYSPLRDETGMPAGVLAIVVETTRRVLNERRNSFLLQTSDRLNEFETAENLVLTVAQELGTLLSANRIGYGRIDEHEVLRSVSEWTDGATATSTSGVYPIKAYGKALAAHLHSGALLVIDDTRTHPLTSKKAQLFEALAIRGLMAVPMMERDRVTAALYVNTAAPRAWSIEDVALVQGVAGRVRSAEERTRNRMELQSLAMTLEERVVERTRALRRSEEALHQSQKMEAVGQLTGGIAHDFNNLLQGIVGSLDLMQKRIAEGRLGELQPLREAAMHSAQRAAALTHRLLAFSRRQPLDPKTVRLNQLIASMADLLRRTMGEKIDIELRLEPELWPTCCDPNQLESALLNLAINARDAMPGGGKLMIATQNVELGGAIIDAHADLEAGQYVRLAVTDTGIGMPPMSSGARSTLSSRPSSSAREPASACR